LLERELRKLGLRKLDAPGATVPSQQQSAHEAAEHPHADGDSEHGGG
jgi:hypothetical protein